MRKYKIPGVTIFEPTRITGLPNIEFGKNIIIDSYTFIYSNKRLKIGNNVHIASFVFLSGGEVIEIGDFVGLFQGCKIYASTDDFKDWGFGNPTIDEKYRNPYRAPVVIGKFAVVGANSVVLPGVTIGEGASVGACSVVTRDLEPWGIYIGNKKIGERNKQGVLDNYAQYLKETEGKR
ncbi:MAG TPA: acyltransferase [Spirochaetota bacterium]|nr:acyltransferase [Spirochaetota bacterium]HPQ52117.1 acyltransferase [Spirochaetota bacterium]